MVESGHATLGNGPVELHRWLLQDAFSRGLESAGIDIYGNPVTFDPEISPDGWPGYAYVVREFVICPYIWDIPDEYEWWRELPNFIDWKTGTKVWWYKYALRDPTANKELGVEDVREMMSRLRDATRALGSTPYEY